MAKNMGSKIKLITILDLLNRHSDENHVISTARLIEMLAEAGISAERKSIYDDIEKLISLDYDIIKTGKGYYLGERRFEMAEIKILIDAVASSKSLSEKKSMAIIKKLESFLSKYEAKHLHEGLRLISRPKSENEQIYYNISRIERAIIDKKAISFNYFNTDINGKKAYRNKGERYTALPITLSYNDDRYYLVSFYEKYNNITNFRVDRMERIEDIDWAGVVPNNFDISNHIKETFDMFGGEKQNLTLSFDNSLLSSVRDKFSDDTVFIPDDERFILNRDIAVSERFYGWLCGFGKKASIISPKSVADDYKAFLQSIIDMH